jgi:Bacterial dnaA protein helix-turn-helix
LPIAIRTIIASVANEFHVTSEQLNRPLAQERDRYSRALAVELCFRLTAASSTQVGRAFGREHATCLYLRVRAGDLLAGSPELRANYATDWSQYHVEVSAGGQALNFAAPHPAGGGGFIRQRQALTDDQAGMAARAGRPL